MTFFSGFNQMTKYFVKIEEIKDCQTERKIEETLNLTNNLDFLEKIKKKEIEFIHRINKLNIELEHTNTGKIKCIGHQHRTIKVYRECSKKNEFMPVSGYAYFIDPISDTFDDNLNVLFEMFPEKMNKQIDPKTRYQNYKSFYEKILKIESSVNQKKQKYENILHIIRTTNNIQDSDFDEKSADENDNNGSDENGHASDGPIRR